MTPAAADERRHPVPRRVLLQVFFRSLLIQAGFNPKAMQGLGYTYALFPALRALYPAGEARTVAVRRHLALFNTHPYFAAAILGGAVRIEERIAAGGDPAEVTRFRNALAAPLAAIGDAFFWSALRPACALLAALVAPSIGLWAVAVFLGLYNAVHLSVRIWLFVIGYRNAEGLVALVGRAQFPIGTRLLQRAAAVMAGAVTAELALIAFRMGGRRDFALVALAAAAAVALASRAGLFLLQYGVLALAVLAGIFS
jgi:PTS system mannose-specific IID component